MKKIAILATVVVSTIIVSCGSKTCTCSNPDNDPTVKTLVDTYLAAVKATSGADTEAACTSLNSTVKLAKSTASCTWG